MSVGARRGNHGAMPPGPVIIKLLKPNFQSVISELIMVATSFTYFSQASAFRHEQQK